MTHTSCITHPAQNQYLIIHKWQVLACAGDVYAAGLLSHIEALHNAKYGIDKYNKHVNSIAELHNKPRDLDENILIPLKYVDIREALFHLCAEKKISISLCLLVKKEFISLHKNPNSENILDRTKYIRFYPEICNAWIRENYNADGSLVNQINKITPHYVKRQSRDCQKAASITPKGGLETAKRQNRWETREEPREFQSQVIDFTDNAKWQSRNCQKAVSITPKGSLYNNINQSISININQDKYKNFDHLNFNKLHDEKKSNVDTNSLEVIIHALIREGFTADKFDYPDAIPAIEHLQQAGATVDLFLKAYKISSQVTQNFGVRYLVKVVGGLLEKSQKKLPTKNSYHTSTTRQKRVTQKTQESENWLFENDLKNAEGWASDLL